MRDLKKRIPSAVEFSDGLAVASATAAERRVEARIPF